MSCQPVATANNVAAGTSVSAVWLRSRDFFDSSVPQDTSSANSRNLHQDVNVETVKVQGTAAALLAVISDWSKSLADMGEIQQLADEASKAADLPTLASLKARFKETKENRQERTREERNRRTADRLALEAFGLLPA